MFKGVYEKLERAGYFLENLKYLEKDTGGLAYVKSGTNQALLANLDGFFFEIISAKDFFLQGINDRYGLDLLKEDATCIKKLKSCLSDRSEEKALKVVKSVEKKLSNKNSWQWQLNNYRNSATHRELVYFWNISEAERIIEVDMNGEPQFQIILDHETKVANELRRVDAPGWSIKFKDAKTYLLKDPEDPLR